jgi:hypothetical protein
MHSVKFITILIKGRTYLSFLALLIFGVALALGPDWALKAWHQEELSYE